MSAEKRQTAHGAQCTPNPFRHHDLRSFRSRVPSIPRWKERAVADISFWCLPTVAVFPLVAWP